MEKDKAKKFNVSAKYTVMTADEKIPNKILPNKIYHKIIPIDARKYLSKVQH